MLRRVDLVLLLCLPACVSGPSADGGLDPDDADVVEIDRFSAEAGGLFVRDDNPELPTANAAIDMDEPPFVTQGLGPQGQVARYYNLDMRPLIPQPGYLFYREGEDSPVEGQLPVIGTIPGQPGYNDFWQVHRVNVPADYVPNTIASVAALEEADHPIVVTEQVLNRPLVPTGSTAMQRPGGGEVELGRAWIGEDVVHFFEFDEAPLEMLGENINYRAIYVCFNINPGEPGGGPPSGFCDEGNGQTHNVLDTLPGDPGYSPLWGVSAYDNADFDLVTGIDSIAMVDVLGMIAMVNCPVGFFESP